MESATQSQKRTCDTTSDLDLCLFCQKKSLKKPTRKLGETGFERVRHAAAERKKYNDGDNFHTIERIQNSDVDEETDIIYHKDCYSTFTSSDKITRLKKKYESSLPSSSTSEECERSRPSLRSEITSMNTDLCIFCQEKSSKKTFLVATFEVSDRIIKGAQTDYVMRCRLAGISDLVAADARYHLQCYVQFNRKVSNSSSSTAQTPRDICMEKVAAEVSVGIARGDIYTLLDVWDRYSSLLSEFEIDAGIYRDNKSRLKEKLLRLLPGQIEFVPQLNPHQPQLLFSAKSSKIAIQRLKQTSDEMETKSSMDDLRPTQFSNSETDELLALHHAALHIRGDINSCPNLEDCTLITMENAEKVVPQTLFLFISILLTGDANEVDDDDFVKRTALSISQDIAYAVSKRKKLTPKHLGLGLAIHQATRSKSLIELIHRAGHCASYDQVRRLDTTIATQNLKHFEDHNNTPIPSNLTFNKFCQYAADNIDIIEETLDGMGTFHATQMVVYQRGHFQQHQKKTLPLGKAKSTKVPPELHRLENVPRIPSREDPKFAGAIREAMFIPEDGVSNKATVQDISWILTRLYGADSNTIPAWTGFNQVTTQDQNELCTIGYLPLINAPAHENNTLWTVMMRCLRISNMLNPGQSTVITLDQQLYCKGKELQWANSDLCKTIFLRLGGFHIAKNFMCVIGNHFVDSGLMEVWTESAVFGENTAQNNMLAKSYNRAIRAHKLTFEAVWTILWPSFIQWAKDHQVDEDELKTLALCVMESLNAHDDLDVTSNNLKALEDAVQRSTITRLLDEFEQTLSPTSKFWVTYIKMVSILLWFLRAERTGNWNLHISSFAAMLPWFAHYDHTNYTRWGAVYLADAMLLETSHPDVHREFMNGNFVVKTSFNTFNQLSTDQALEHVNKVGKVAGGLVGITRSEGARDQWCLTFNERSRIVDDTSSMLGMHTADEDFSPTNAKEAGPSRIKRDKQDVQKIVDQLNRFAIFQHQNPCIVSLATRDIASQQITESLLTAHDHGREKMRDFVDSRLVKKNVGFHDKLQKSKNPTLKTMYQVKSKNPALKEKTVKADRNLFQRLLVSKDAGRHVDLKKILSHELSPVPLSLSDTSGVMRSTNKAVLGSILQATTTVEKQLPVANLKTCVIIDGQALVQAIGKPSNAKTFGGLADRFIASVFSHFSDTCSRVDVVFDRYEEHTIKDTARIVRSGKNRPIRRKVDNRDVPLPINWRQFIDLPENKQDLEHFLSLELIRQAKAVLQNQEVVTAGGFHDRMAVESSLGNDVLSLQSNHDEADTRILLHAKSAKEQGFERLVISSRDTDVLVLLIHFADDLSREIWFQTGTAKQRSFVAVHAVDIEPALRLNLPGLHAISGCDTVSQLCGIGKSTAWKTFVKHCHLLDGLGRGTLNETTLENVESFICRLYSSNESDTNVNDVRFKMFLKGSKEPEKLPPTQSSLKLHIKRAHHQCTIWYSSLTAILDICSPIENGWNKDSVTGNILPQLMNDEPFPDVYLKLTQCQCKNCESHRCGCRLRELRCTAGCSCSEGTCRNPLNSAQDDSD